jgi:hypothetical protein
MSGLRCCMGCKSKLISTYEAAHEETSALTETIIRMEKEIDKMV